LHFEVVTKLSTTPPHYLARIVGGNGEIVFSPQRYRSKESAKHACQIVQAYAATSQIYEKTEY
jgi:uncharacterized protein YegP (UPF0339 family)